MSTEYLKQAAILGTFVETVRKTGQSCGETLLQKAAYVMQALFNVPLSDEFRIHYYGPFSFQLRDRLASMEADDIVRVSPRELGVTYDTGDRFAQLRERFPKTIETYLPAIEFVASRLGTLGVKQLEPLATALFITRQHPGLAAADRVSQLLEIKPHVRPADAASAIQTVDQWITEAAA